MMIINLFFLIIIKQKSIKQNKSQQIQSQKRSQEQYFQLKMKQKLILTLWKAQFNQLLPTQQDSLMYCRINYNNESKNTKVIVIGNKMLEWKQTFVFLLGLEQTQLRIDFILLKKGEQIHFAKDNVLQESLSACKSIFVVPVKSATKGSLPSKLDIVDSSNNSLGKLFIQYQILKTQISYIVQKMVNYKYFIRLSNFRVSFMRKLKKNPNFYLKFYYGQKVHRQQFPFGQQKNGQFLYNYPIKLYMNKQPELKMQLQIRDFFGLGEKQKQQRKDNNNKRMMEELKSEYSTKRFNINDKNNLTAKGRSNTVHSIAGNTANNMIDIDLQSKINAVLDLSGFLQKQKDKQKEENLTIKQIRKLSLTMLIKGEVRDIGSVEFQVQVVYKKNQQKAQNQKKKGLRSPSLKNTLQAKNKSKPTNNQSPTKKKGQPNVQQSNGFINITTIMAKLQVSEQDYNKKLHNKKVSLSLQLGKQVLQSSVLQNPGRELIFLDTFCFKRTWEELIKITVESEQIDANMNTNTNMNSNNKFQPIIKKPIYFASINLRDLFQSRQITNKKVKIVNQQKQQCGLFILDMTYEEDTKKSNQLNKSMSSIQDDGSKKSQEQSIQKDNKSKKDIIKERMNLREMEKKHNKEKVVRAASIKSDKQRDVITMSEALDLKQLILPPLKNRRRERQQSQLDRNNMSKRYTTLSPTSVQKKQAYKFLSANIYNSNGAVKFSRSPRFEDNYQNRNKSGSSFSLVRQSDFDTIKSIKRGPFIGYGQKHDFTKNVQGNPGIGKYMIPSLWDKYH